MKLKNFSSLLLGLVVSLSISVPTFADTKLAVPKDNNVQTVSMEKGIKSKPIVLKDGEHAKIPLKLEKDSNATNKGTYGEVFPGDGGYVDIWRSGDHVYYKVSVDVVTTGFLGYVSITDRTSGLNAGFAIVKEFDGSATFTEFSNHTYSASIHGTAFNGAKPVATTVDNEISWTCE